VVPRRLSTDPTIRDLEWPFYVKFCFAQIGLDFLREFRKHNRAKINKGIYRSILSAAKCSALTLVLRFVRLFARVLQFLMKIFVRPESIRRSGYLSKIGLQNTAITA